MKTVLKFGIIWLALLAVIIVPFAVFGDRMDNWTAQFIRAYGSNSAIAGFVLAGLLASDIALPVPSSVISTACGFVLGAVWGTIASLAGMSASCAAGYWIGRKAGRPAASRLMSPDEISNMDRMNGRFGEWLVVICRPVPVLAEASVFFAGMSRLNFGRFMLLSTLSNLAVSVVYASVGALSQTIGAFGFLLAFATSVAAPGIAMLLTKGLGRKK